METIGNSIFHCPISGFTHRNGSFPAILSGIKSFLFLVLLTAPFLASQAQITASDCHQAVMMCGSGNFQITPNGFGNIMELIPGTTANPNTNPASTNDGCLQQGERNSTWLMFRTYRPGTVEFSFGTPGPVQCYDWALYRYNPNICQQILNNQVAPLRCNWNRPCNSFTGVANILPGGGMAGNFEPPFQAGCEDTFLICFSNYGAITSNVFFNYFGTASISCNQVASMNLFANPSTICQGDTTILGAQNATQVSWTPHPSLNRDTGNTVFANPYQTTNYQAIGFNGCRWDTGFITVTVIPPPAIQFMVTPSSRCDTCDGTITVNLITPIPPGNYFWSNNLGNSLHLTGLCGGTRYFTYNHLGCQRTVPVPVGAPSIGNISISTTPETCVLSDGTATVTHISPPGNYQLTWSTSPVQTGYTATGLSVGWHSVLVFDPTARCQRMANVYVHMIGGFSTALSVTHTTCPYSTDGRLDAITSGGIPPYQYTWNTTPVQTTPFLTGLAPGAYSVSVRDSAGCVRHYTGFIAAGPPVVTWNTITPISCIGWSDGAILMNRPPNTPPYTFSWNTIPVQTTAQITGLAAGTYQVRVQDARGCTTNVVIPLHNPPRLRISVTPTAVSCFGMSNGSAQGNPVNPPVLYDVTWHLQPPVTNIFQVNNLSPGTYTVSLSSRTGCTGTDTFEIREPEPLQLNATSYPAICHAPNGGMTALASGGTTPYSYIWSHLPSPGTGPPGLGGMASGNYTIVVRDSNNCRDTLTVLVPSERDSLYLSATIQSQSCQSLPNATFTLHCQGQYAPFSYSLNGGTPVPSNTFTGLSAGTYQIRAYNSRGCYKDTVILVPLDPVDDPGLTALIEGQQCPSLPNGEVTLNGHGTHMPFLYAFNNGLPDTTRYFSQLSAGTYPVRITNAAGCFIDTVVIIPNQVYTMHAQLFTTDAFCSAGQNGNIEVRGHSPYPPYQYSFNGSTASTQQVFPNLSPNTYTIRITDSDGCVLDTFATVGWTPYTFTPDFQQTPPSCFNESNGWIQIDTSGMHPPLQFSWTLPMGTSTALPAVNTGAGSWTVQITDAWNCLYDANGWMTEPELLSLSATGQNPDCHGGNNGSIQLQATGGTSPWQFTWNHQPIGSTMTNLYQGYYTLSVSDVQGCADTIDIILTEPEAMQLQGQTYPTACPGISDGSIQVQLNGGMAPYQYFVNHVAHAGPPFTSLAPGNYLISVSDARGCFAEEQFQITSFTRMEASLKFRNLVCFEQEDGEIQLTPLSGTPPFQYYCNNLPTQTQPDFVQLSAGHYTVRIQDSRGCEWDTVVTLTQPEEIKARATTSPPDCYGNATGKAFLEISGGIPEYQYQLSPDYFAPVNQIQGLQAGTYSVLVSDARGCRKTVTFEIPEGPRPEPPAILPDTVCPGESARLITWPAEGTQTLWYDHLEDTQMLFGGTQFYIPEPKRTDTFFVSTIDADGCESRRVPIRVIVAQNPIAGFQSDYVTRELPGAIFTFTDKSVGHAPVAEWLWEFGDGEISDLQDPVHEYAQPGSYPVKLTIVDQNGCRSSVLKSAYLEVQMSVMMVTPNAFSPNGDGINDFFRLPNYNIATWEVQIYDRWGNLVYQTDNLEFRWDGSVQGSVAPEGSYTYTVSGHALDQTPVFKSGSILLMR